jgi:hypothetical protein
MAIERAVKTVITLNLNAVKTVIIECNVIISFTRGKKA